MTTTVKLTRLAGKNIAFSTMVSATAVEIGLIALTRSVCIELTLPMFRTQSTQVKNELTIMNIVSVLMLVVLSVGTRV